MTIARREIRYGGAMLDQKEIDAVVNVMQTSMVVSAAGADLREALREAAGPRSTAMMVNSGSSALMLALRLLDLPKGSEVITPTLTFGTDISSIVLNGHVPVLVDVEPDTYQIDIDKIERNITAEDPRHAGSEPGRRHARLGPLRAIADKHGLNPDRGQLRHAGRHLPRHKPAGKRATSASPASRSSTSSPAWAMAAWWRSTIRKLWDRALMLRAWGRSSEKFMHGTRKGDSDGRFLENSATSNTTACSSSRRSPTASFRTRRVRLSVTSSSTSSTCSPNCARNASTCTAQYMDKRMPTCSSRRVCIRRRVHHLDLLPGPCCARNSAGAVARCRCIWKRQRHLHAGDLLRPCRAAADDEGRELPRRPGGLPERRARDAPRPDAALPPDDDPRGLPVPVPGARRVHRHASVRSECRITREQTPCWSQDHPAGYGSRASAVCAWAPICLAAHSSPRRQRAILETFFASGGNFIDTAHSYGDWIAGDRAGSKRAHACARCSPSRPRDELRAGDQGLRVRLPQGRFRVAGDARALLKMRSCRQPGDARRRLHRPVLAAPRRSVAAGR
jgi:hypothetical protein